MSTDGFPKIPYRPVTVVVHASAGDLVPWRIWGWNGYSDSVVNGKQQTIILRRGYEVSGVCVDEKGEPAGGAQFRLYHLFGGVSGESGLQTYRCNDKGEFRFQLPKKGTKAYWIVGDTLAPKFVRAPGEAKANLRYQLQSGARAIGFVKDANGNAISDVVVQAVSKNDGDVPGYTLPFQAAARTDKKGRFRLPPVRGEYTIRLTSAGDLLDGSTFEAPEPAPVMMPVLREFDSGRKPLVLRPTKSALVSGICRWPDKTPAADTMIAAYGMPEGNGTGLSLGRTITDKQGRYAIRIPVPIANLVITADGRRWGKTPVQAVASGNSEQFEYNGWRASAKLFEDDTTLNFDFAE